MHRKEELLATYLSYLRDHSESNLRHYGVTAIRAPLLVSKQHYRVFLGERSSFPLSCLYRYTLIEYTRFPATDSTIRFKYTVFYYPLPRQAHQPLVLLAHVAFTVPLLDVD